MQPLLSILAILGLAAGSAQALEPRDGWVVRDTAKS